MICPIALYSCESCATTELDENNIEIFKFILQIDFLSLRKCRRIYTKHKSEIKKYSRRDAHHCYNKMQVYILGRPFRKRTFISYREYNKMDNTVKHH